MVYEKIGVMRKLLVLVALAIILLIGCEPKNQPNELVSISVAPIYTGDYIVGDTITNEDITVNALYTDGSVKAVTAWTTEEDFSVATANKEIIISYAEGDVVKTSKLLITIVDAYEITSTFSSDVNYLPDDATGTFGAYNPFNPHLYVEFGTWPQSLKEDSVAIQERQKKVVGYFTYCAGSDGNWYCKVPHKDGNDCSWFKVEPIKWATNGSKLIAENGLMANIPYYDDREERLIESEIIYPNNYQHSKIRAFLNGLSYNKGGVICDEFKDKGFLQTAFSAEAQEKILEAEVDNSCAYSNKYSCANTRDKIFLASDYDVSKDGSNMFLKHRGRDYLILCQRESTAFAIANCPGVYSSCILLRSPSDLSSFGILHGVNSEWGPREEPLGRGFYHSDVDDVNALIVPILSIE